MFNKEEIRIAKIKDISLIYFFFSNELAKNDLSYLGLKIIYDNGKSLSYDYRNEYFEKYLLKVLEVYKKNNSNIEFYNKESKEILERLLNESTNKDEKEELQEFRNYSFFDYSLETNIALYYVKDMILDYIKTYLQNEEVEIKFSKKRNNEFIVQYNNDSKNTIVGNVSKIDINKYAFNFYHYADEHLKGSGVISFGKQHVSGIWQDKDKKMRATNVYHINEDKREKQISRDDQEIYYKEDINVELNDKELTIINKIIELCNIDKFDKIIKNTDNSYMLFNSNVDGNTGKEVICFVNINNNNFTVLLEETNGIINEKTNTLLAKDNKKYSYYGKIELFEDQYILSIEKQSYNTNFEVGEYKNSIGKYKYDYYLSTNDFLNNFKIYEKLNPEEEIVNINSLSKVLKR